MIKAIILDDGYHSKDVVVKFGKNYVRRVVSSKKNMKATM